MSPPGHQQLGLKTVVRPHQGQGEDENVFLYNFLLKTLIYNGNEISILRNFIQQI